MIKPMLCMLQQEPIDDDRHLWEIKYDGIRGIIEARGDNYSIQSRSGKDKTLMFPELRLETRGPVVLDGELVCYNDEGVLVFKGVQRRANRVRDIARMSKLYPATYEVFDILAIDEQSLQHLPLEERKRLLKAALIPTDNVRIAPYASDAIDLFNKAQAYADHYNLTGELLGHKEGVVGKLKIGDYRQGKRDWVKVKTFQSSKFIICGYTEGTGWRASTFGALVLGKERNGEFVYVGDVGTGYDREEIQQLYRRMNALKSASCPFNEEPEKATWITPSINVLIQYLELTDDGLLRFPSYKGEVD